MGIYDREYYRDEDQPRGFRVPAGGYSMVIILMVINGVLFLLNMFTQDNLLTTTLSLQADDIFKPWLWWKFLTCGFAHSSRTNSYGLPMHILGNMFVLWMFGRDVERVYGRWEFLRIYLVAIVLGSVVWALRTHYTTDVPYYLLGASGAVAAVLILFVCHFPKRTVLFMFFIPMPVWVLGVFVILINLFGVQAENTNVAYDVHLVGIGFAFAYFKLH